MAEIRTCTVSYQDIEGVKHSVDVSADSLYEAAALGMAAMKVPDWQNAPNLVIEVRVRAPEIMHSISNSVLAAWLARNGKTPKEQAVKARIQELLRA
jgi:DNA-binding transcriptional LysR family regulator